MDSRRRRANKKLRWRSNSLIVYGWLWYALYEPCEALCALSHDLCSRFPVNLEKEESEVS